MPFQITVGFPTEHDRNDFLERIMPKVRGHQVEPESPPEDDGVFRAGVEVTSPSAARDLCHQIVAFLAHSKKDRVFVSWKGADGSVQTGDVTGESARDAEILSVRIGAAARAHIDKEKEGAGG